MKKCGLFLSVLACLTLVGCQKTDSTSTTSTGSSSTETSSSSVADSSTGSETSSSALSIDDATSILTVTSTFTFSTGNLGAFSLGLTDSNYTFIDQTITEDFSSFTLGGAFTGMSFYLILLQDYELNFYIYGDLASGYEYGTVSGSGILEEGGTFTATVPIADANLTIDGFIYPEKSENSLTLTLEHSYFHKDISAKDIVLGGGFQDATISSITYPEILTDDSAVPYTLLSNTITITMTGTFGPEEYGFITLSTGSTTFHEDIFSNFDIERQGAELVTDIITFDLKDTLIFTFANLTPLTTIETDDITVSGALTGTTIDSVSVYNDREEGNLVVLDVTYPASFFSVALEEDADLSGSFIFASTTNQEEVEFEVKTYVPAPEIYYETTYDSTTKVATTLVYFANGKFNSALTTSDISFVNGLSETTIEVSDLSVKLGTDLDAIGLTFTMPSDHEFGLVQINIENSFYISYSNGDAATAQDISLIEFIG